MAFDVVTAWRALSFLMTGWLAFFFGRTLRPGHEALITRIARVSEPTLPPYLVSYTRRLTAVWCAYFIVAAVVAVAAAPAARWSGILVWSGTAALFLGEHWLRPRFFPGQSFPGVLQQVKDTLQVWRPAGKGR